MEALRTQFLDQKVEIRTQDFDEEEPLTGTLVDCDDDGVVIRATSRRSADGFAVTGKLFQEKLVYVPALMIKTIERMLD